MPFAETWMELEILILSEVSEGERQIPYDVICVWNLKYGTSEPIFKTETDIENRLVVAKGEGLEEGWSGRLRLADANYCTWRG